MKRVFVLAFLLLGLMSVQVNAQEVSEEVTEEEMMKFAAMEANFLEFMAGKQAEVEEMIKTNEIIGEGGARYNEIKAAWGNEEKLAEIEITEEETAEYQRIQDFIASLGDVAREYKTDLIMDAEVLGAATYNKVNKAMKENPEVKAKVDSLIAEMKEKDAEEDGDTVTDSL
ncbi:hypothetical protein Belba_2655 [Belliella baltica DSM 15883]|uniref:DUF4168 domain-containing protein n=1 Tax=Belliella baltica (strain DSM 15883 / CIP 108006 / LMG 21964 / BA134) TaxID=866536 RepID=I3Z7I2_BELBD|nr:hypothetical protein [Belliella baltica]AFL85200.1 hypothetical protein Belba_2655 [Belliella baltica DSM 15883]